MSEDPPNKPASAEQKQARKAQQAQDGAKAMNEYRNREMAMRDRTAKLRAQRLAREAREASEAKQEAEKPKAAKKPAAKKKEK